MPSSCAVATTSSHCAAGSLPLVSTQRTSSSRISAAVPGIEPSPASRSSVSHSVIDTPALADGADDLHRGERVHVHVGHRGLHRADQVGVEGDRQLRVDAALHADLGGAVGGRLHGAGGDLVQRQPERVGVALALGERAEPAAHVADVREVDVAVDHVGDVVADDVGAQPRRPGRSAPPAPGRRPGSAPSRRAVWPGRAARPGRTRPAPARRGRRRRAARARPAGWRPARRAARPSRRRRSRSRRAGPRCGPRRRWRCAGRCARSRRTRRRAPATAGPTTSAPSSASPVAGSASAATCACSRVSIHGEPAMT